MHRLAHRTRQRQTGALAHRLIPAAFWRKTGRNDILREGINVTGPADNRLQARNDLAWAISVGGIGVVLFAALLLFTWHFAATLFLIFAGMLLGVALNAMSNLLGRVVRLPHALRLTIVCLALAGMLSGIVFLGGATIAQQTTVLSNTHQVATRQRQGVPGEERHRHQLLRFRQACRSPSDAADAGDARRRADAQASQRRHDCVQRRRDRQPEPEADAGHRQRGRKLLHRAVSGTGLRRAAGRLPRRAAVHGAGQASRARHRRSSTASARRWSAG